MWSPFSILDHEISILADTRLDRPKICLNLNLYSIIAGHHGVESSFLMSANL